MPERFRPALTLPHRTQTSFTDTSYNHTIPKESWCNSIKMFYNEGERFQTQSTKQLHVVVEVSNHE